MEKKKCEYCDKVIEGFTKKQIEHLMNQHLVSVHKDKIKIVKR